MKKIALIVWDMSVLGGINQVASTLANEFCKKYEVYIVSLVKGRGKACPILKPEIKGVTYIIKRECRGREVVTKGKKVLNIFLKENKIDIVFLMGFQVALPVLLMTYRRKCKYIFCDHEALMSRWHEKKITFVRWGAAMMSDKVVTLTYSNALDYQKYFCLPKTKVSYIYNSIDDKVLEKASKCYDKSSKVILSVGRFSPEKGYDLLIRIAKVVLGKYPDWKWYIYGDGETFSEIQKDILKNNLQEQVFLKGEVADVSEIYGQGALFVLTSRREGLPLVLIEAKANSLPCVSFDVVSGPREIIRDGVDGVLIQEMDLKEMEKAIEMLICNEALRVEMALRSKENLEQFSKRKIMEQWDELIESLTKR
ncbi:glycosyltransferase family 4 protein [Roseburia hominis]